MGISPCKYPGCRDSNGEPYLTRDGMCEPCQNRFARLLGWLVLDWVNLSTSMPTPASRGRAVRARQSLVYGHPAEWASDTAAEIAAVLNGTHDSLADLLGDTPPPHPGIAERLRVRSAWYYLECRIPQLAAADFGGDMAEEMKDLHGKIRSSLGLTRPRRHLPTPCPSCELRTLFRALDAHNDSIDCGNCGHVIREEHYPFYTRVVLDTLLEQGVAA